ncbi:MAG: DMT family transporter, partial [Tissierella sp.]|uniref:DMT family transporter n=1 Tax=Tissierella sp. TaxID=41274 RepID=UPI003F9D0811
MIKDISPKFKIIIAVITWGTLGLFVRNINLTSIEISFFRAFIGSMFLMFIIFINREGIDKNALKENILYLSISGLALGINWSVLFQAMKYTTISNATLSYYFAPVFIVVFSSILLKEKITIKNISCILISILGLFMILKSGDNENLNNYNHIKGVMFGLFGAVFYAIVVVSNKYIKGLSSLQIT